MDVQDPASERGNGRRTKDAHEPGQDDEVDGRTLELGGDGPIPGIPIGVGRRLDDARGDALRGREFDGRARAIGEDQTDGTAEQPAPLGAKQREEVRAAAGDAHRDALGARRRPVRSLGHRSA